MNHLTHKSSTSTEWPEQALPQEWVERLFEKMLYEYGAKFSNQWGGLRPEQMLRHWAVRLYGLTRAELKTGMAALEGREWPPTVPEFVKLCKPAVDPLRAYHEALAGLAAREHGEVGQWSHPAIFHAAVRIGRHTLQTSEWRHIRERWEQVLADVLAEGSWEEVKAPPLRIGLSASRDAVDRALAQLRALGATMQPKNGTGWANKVIARHAAGDQRVTPAMLECAQQALARTPGAGAEAADAPA